MAIYGQAVKKLIAPGSSDPRINARAVVLHVDAGDSSSLYGWFNGPSGGVESHFHIQRGGGVEQYRDTAYQADANLAANAFAISVETQGREYGEWTGEQLAAIKDLIMWAHQTHGVPLRVCRNAYDSGIGYHTLFPGVWDNRGASCPGPDRKRQFHNVIVPWLNSGGGGGAKPSTSSAEKAPAPAPVKKYTREDVASFQRAHNLDDDGIYGILTYKQALAIRRTLKKGVKFNRFDLFRYYRLKFSRTKKQGRSSQDMRRSVQWALGFRGAEVDGDWGDLTDAAWFALRDQHYKRK